MYNNNFSGGAEDVTLECMCDCIQRIIADYGAVIFAEPKRAGALIGDYLTDSRVASKKNLLRRCVSSGAFVFIAQAEISDGQYLRGRKNAIELLVEEEFIAPEVAETVLAWFDRALEKAHLVDKKAETPPSPPTPPTPTAPPVSSPDELEMTEKRRISASIASYCKLVDRRANEALNADEDLAYEEECTSIYVRMVSISNLNDVSLTVEQLKEYENELIAAYNRLGEIIEIAKQPRIRELPFITTVFWGAPLTYVRGVPFTLMDNLLGPVGYYTVACLEYGGMQYIVAKQPQWQYLFFCFKVINNMLYRETDINIYPKLEEYCRAHNLG